MLHRDTGDRLMLDRDTGDSLMLDRDSGLGTGKPPCSLWS